MFVLVAKRRTPWRELDKMVNTVNKDRFMEFAPGCLRVCDLYTCAYSRTVAALVDLDVAGHADFCGPYLGMDRNGLPKTECVCAFPRRLFMPHFGLCIDFSWAPGETLVECCESLFRSKMQAYFGKGFGL